MLLKLRRSLYFLFIYLGSHTFGWGQDQDAIFEVANIRIVGNNRTKEFVIHRELTFSIGDKLSYLLIDTELEKSLLNLKNTSLFAGDKGTSVPSFITTAPPFFLS